MALEVIIGILIFAVLLDLIFSFVPLPRGIMGTILTLLIIVFVWRIAF